MERTIDGESARTEVMSELEPEIRKRRRSLSVADKARLGAARIHHLRKRRHGIDRAQTAHIAAAAAREASRRYAATVASAWDCLPPFHDSHSFITSEQSEGVIRIMAVLYENMNGDSRWLGRAVKHALAARGTGISESIVREIWKKFDEDSEFYETDRPVPPKTHEDKKWDSLACEFFDTEIPRAAALGRTHNAKSLQQQLKNEFGYDYSIYIIRRLLGDLEYTYCHLKQDWAVGMKSARRQRQLFLHLLLFDQAIAEVDAGKAIMLVTDQTFIDTRAHIRFGYQHPDKTFFLFPKGTGDRIAHMHALSAYGLLAVNDADGTPLRPPSDDDIKGHRAKTDAATAELIFHLKRGQRSPESDSSEAQKPGFSAEVCADWVTHRFIPAARRIWPSPIKLYLYMDNFSGHTGRDKNRIWPRGGKGHTRAWNLQGLKAAGCTQLLLICMV